MITTTKCQWKKCGKLFRRKGRKQLGAKKKYCSPNHRSYANTERWLKNGK